MAIDQATKSHVLMRTRAKICGITRSQDILSVVQAGADAIGFVFFPPSPRYVSPAQAQQLIELTLGQCGQVHEVDQVLQPRTFAGQMDRLCRSALGQ